MAAAVEYNSAPFSRRAISFGAIIAVHVLLIWAFSSGLAIRVISMIAPPLQTDIIEEMQKRDEPLPPPPPKMERPQVEIPPPEVDINLPVETSSAAITDVSHKPAAPAA